MGLGDLLRKGFGYALLTMGVSRPTPTPKAEPLQPKPQTDSTPKSDIQSEPNSTGVARPASGGSARS
jgi:hypothetical protein